MPGSGRASAAQRLSVLRSTPRCAEGAGTTDCPKTRCPGCRQIRAAECRRQGTGGAQTDARFKRESRGNGDEWGVQQKSIQEAGGKQSQMGPASLPSKAAAGQLHEGLPAWPCPATLVDILPSAWNPAVSSSTSAPPPHSPALAAGAPHPTLRASSRCVIHRQAHPSVTSFLWAQDFTADKAVLPPPLPHGTPMITCEMGTTAPIGHIGSERARDWPEAAPPETMRCRSRSLRPSPALWAAKCLAHGA